MSNQNAQALQVALSHLAGALTYTEPTNIETNKKLWNEYANNYSHKQSNSSSQSGTDGAAAASPSGWVLDMASQVQRGAEQLEFLGDEWSDDASLTQSLNHFLFPYLGVDTLTPDEWAESRATEAAIAGRTHTSDAGSGSGPAFGPECSGGSIPLVNHLPPSSLQAWCGAQAASPLSARLLVGELGVGGGRVAARVYPHVQHLHAFDISEGMLRQAQRSIAAKHHRQTAADAPASPTAATASDSADSASAAELTAATGPAPSATAADGAPATAAVPAPAVAVAPAGPSNVSFHLLTNAPAFPPRLRGTLDLLYCFDVMPHVDLHTISHYFRSIRALLRPRDREEDEEEEEAPVAESGDGSERHCRRRLSLRRPPPRAFLHTANLCAPLGWDRFMRQKRCTAGGFYFLSPDMVRQLARQHGYRIVQESRWTVARPDLVPSPSSAAPAAAASSSAAVSTADTSNLYYQRDFLFVMEMI